MEVILSELAARPSDVIQGHPKLQPTCLYLTVTPLFCVKIGLFVFLLCRTSSFYILDAKFFVSLANTYSQSGFVIFFSWYSLSEDICLAYQVSFYRFTLAFTISIKIIWLVSPYFLVCLYGFFFKIFFF